MWVLGLIVFYLFYKLCIDWYAVNCTKDAFERPMVFMRHWFHPAMWAIGLLLLSSSAYVFFLSTPRLVVAPLVLALFMFWRKAQERRTDLNDAIRTAVLLNEQLEREGIPVPRRNAELVRRMTGDDSWSDDSWSPALEALLDVSDIDKFVHVVLVILERRGLYSWRLGSQELEIQSRNPSYVSQEDRIRALVKFYRESTGSRPNNGRSPEIGT
jgi:hypothetical protein